MATRKHSRSDRSGDRAGGNRPRTHPTEPVSDGPSENRGGPREQRPTPAVLAALTDIRLRLEVAAAVAAVTSVALKSQKADSDEDAAIVLQRCVCDALAEQIERLKDVIAKASAGGGRRVGDGGAS
jgi:hypothetical protein